MMNKSEYDELVNTQMKPFQDGPVWYPDSKLIREGDHDGALAKIRRNTLVVMVLYSPVAASYALISPFRETGDSFPFPSLSVPVSWCLWNMFHLHCYAKWTSRLARIKSSRETIKGLKQLLLKQEDAPEFLIQVETSATSA